MPVAYSERIELPPVDSTAVAQTQFDVVGADCLEIAELLKKAGYNVCVLNMASRQNPGGGVLHGAGAQEENLFRRTNLFRSLYQFSDYAREYFVKRNETGSYPLDRTFGGIYSEKVVVFRGSEKSGYCLLRAPFQVAVVTVPAMNRPELVRDEEGAFFIAPHLVEPTKEKIRTMLRICVRGKSDCLVLGAWGCGAFRNPPAHMARLFREVFSEAEFKNRFRHVVFAIVDDHNSRKEHNPEGNFFPFLREMDGFCG